jgi:hypothetical protein
MHQAWLGNVCVEENAQASFTYRHGGKSVEPWKASVPHKPAEAKDSNQSDAVNTEIPPNPKTNAKESTK